MNNWCFLGKFIENQRQQKDIKIAGTKEHAMKYLSSPMTTGYTLVNERMMIFEMIKRKIEINRPIQIGVSILEYSKVIMYDYYFTVLKKAFGSRIRLLYTDTDSYIVELLSKDIPNDLKSISSTLDTSNFPKSNHILAELFTEEHASNLFYFKSEVGADSILAFVAIRAKVYSLIRTNTKDGNTLLEIISKLKGVNRSSVEKLGM
jgi:hypothetical protein